MTDEETNKQHFEDLCAGFVLDALEPEEREEFEQLLQNASEEERELYQRMRSAANQIAFSIDETEAPEAVRERILRQVRTGEERDEESSIQTLSEGEEEAEGFDRTTFALAASFALLLVTLSLVFYSFNLSFEISTQEEVIQEQQTRISELQNEIEQKEELLSILESREVDLVLMSGMEANPNGYGKVIWDAQSNRALLQVSNLPAVPSDKIYQLWIIKNNKPVSAGVFSVNDPDKDSFFKIEEMNGPEQPADAFAVTMEPKGGMPQPTGDWYLMGNRNKN